MFAWTPSHGYLICCLERTGSNLLGEALLHTGCAGRPLEYFSPVLQDKPWMRDILGEDTLLTGFSKVLRAGTTRNGVFGIKIHWSHFRYLARGLSSPDQTLPPVEPGGQEKLLAQLPDLVPTEELLRMLRARAGDRAHFVAAYRFLAAMVPGLRVVWLRRENMVARSISHCRALHSQVWSRSQSEAAKDAVPEFDPVRLHKMYVLGLFQDESWQWLFGELGVQPYCVTYEQLVEDYEPTVRGVLNFLGLGDFAGPISPTRLARQADGVSQEWEARYRELSALRELA
jgi:LPS sulfotransferase NodH